MAVISPDQEEVTPGQVAEQDQTDAAFRDITENYDKTAPEPSQPPGKVQGQLSGSKSSLKKKLLIGGASIGGISGLAVILFFMLLFKNIHIKNLFMSYEFAKFNRGFRNRLEKSINEADPNGTGTADSTVADGAAPDVALAEVSAAEIKKLQGDPSAIEDAVTQAETLDQSSAGTAGVIDPGLGVDPAIADETGKPSDQVTTDTNTEIKDEIGAGETSTKPPPIDSIDAATKATSAAIDAGENSTSVLKTIAGNAYKSKLNGIFQKAQGPLFFATLGCIVENIYLHGVNIYTQLKFGGLAKSAATVAKYADCQKLGKCSLSQIGAVSSKFDGTVDGKPQSFMDSCAAVRASGEVAQPGVNCTDLDPNLRPSSDPSQVGGPEGVILTIAKAAATKVCLPATKPKLCVSMDIGCDAILYPPTQAALAATGVVGAFAGGFSGIADFGVSDALTAAAWSGSVIITSKAGSALAFDAALHYGGLLFKQNFGPIQWGNLMGAGSKALATDSCRVDGCRPLTQPENTGLSLAIHGDMIKEQQSRGLAYRMFSPENPVSTMGLLVDKMPASPRTAMAAIGQLFATMLNPGHLGKSFLGLINPIRPAWAADTEYQTYGIPDYGFTDGELNSIGVVDNTKWVQEHLIKKQMDDFDKCISGSTKMGDILSGKVSGCDATTMSSPEFTHYRLYKLDTRVTHDLVLLYNNQPEPGADTTATSATPASGPNAGCVNPFTDPRWSVTRTDEGVDYDTPSGVSLPVYAICDGTITSTIGTLGKGWPGGVYINYKLTSGPFTGKCIYTAEQLTNVLPVGTNVKAGQQIALAQGGTEWGWSQGVQTPASQGAESVATEGGKAFARFIKSLGGRIRDDPGPGPLYAGVSCQ